MTKIPLKFICLGFIFALITNGQAAQKYQTSADAELDTIITHAYETSDLARKALDEEKAFREITIQQLNELSEKAKGSCIDGNFNNWEGKILQRIETDKQQTEQLNEALKPFTSGVTARFSVKTNKIKEILENVPSLIKGNLESLKDGYLPLSYVYNQPTITILGGENKETIWGNSRGTFLKAAYLYMACTPEQGEPKGFDSMGWGWYDSSALAHVAPLPKDLAIDLTSYSFVMPTYNQEFKRGLIYLHSGYAYGGHRSEACYPDGKRFGPHDCSSWSAALTGSVTYTTADQYVRKLVSDNFDFSQIKNFNVENWKAGRDAQYLLNGTETVTVTDPQRDIRPGQIYAHRRFADKAAMTTTLGSGGHTALVLGFRTNGNIVTLGYNRDMPALEGFGIQEFPWAPEENKVKMLFDIKKQ